MKYILKIILSVDVLLIILLTSNVFACTTIIVGKDASSNESGDFIYEDEGTKLKVELPKKMYQYFFTPEKGNNCKGEWGQVGSNEMGVCMTATETISANEIALKYDPYVKNGVAESNIIRLIIPYVKTAR